MASEKVSSPAYFIQDPDPKNIEELAKFLTCMQDDMCTRFQDVSTKVLGRIGTIENGIEDLEKQVQDIMSQGGQTK